MTKADLIEAMAKDAGISKVAAGAALDSFVDGIVKTLKKKDGKITLVGFGTFSKGRRKARTDATRRPEPKSRSRRPRSSNSRPARS